ncbi:cytidine deaminase [Roseateles oligotrophus]|uniref:Cytidine deaminase n=1 Tax=Roseateles oligotrophus TaxID=1769250 RepID=A0ABT2YLQ6_9BURK|nr:cytidine deaminase [Roseateles oligotrophus]MCV2370932.1 cytidine deaminase [Roseateles oligotrophus]
MDLSEEVQAKMLQASLGARQHSHSPYSGYAVGAALLDEQGRIHVGTNIENAAYPQGWCAEASALTAMVMAGGKQAVAVLVTGPGPDVITPCGGCRQKLREFAGQDLLIIAGDPSGIKQQWTLGELLPFSFGPEHLSSKA